MKKYLVVGLGNPGTRFEATRHNLGARVVHAWTDGVPALPPATEIIVGLPTEKYMNDSGEMVGSLARQHHIDLTNIIVVHDDVELPLGQIKIKQGGSAAGHNGVRSVIGTLGSDQFTRVRVGIGRPETLVALEKFVLEKFSVAEEVALPQIMWEAGELITQLISGPTT